MSVVIFSAAGIDGTVARWIQITATSTQTVTDGGRPPGSESDSGHPRPPRPLPCGPADVLQSSNTERWAAHPAGARPNRRLPLTGGCSREKVSAAPSNPSPLMNPRQSRPPGSMRGERAERHMSRRRKPGGDSDVNKKN